MPGVPKPPKPEKSRIKGGKERSRDPSWKKSERESARWLQDQAGVDPNPPVPPSSTGRVGHFTMLGYDTTSARYVGEVKRRELPKWILEAWVQIVQCALRRGDRHPVAIFDYSNEQGYFVYNEKKLKLPQMHVITPERHAELLRYEDAVKGAERVSEITKGDIMDIVEAPESPEKTE